MLVHAIRPSDHSDWVSIHRLSNRKVYTEGVDCSPTDILLSEIVNKFITSTVLAAMISSANIKIYFKNLFKNICCRNAWEDWIIFFFSKKVIKPSTQ